MVYFSCYSAIFVIRTLYGCSFTKFYSCFIWVSFVFKQLAIMEEANKLRESATDVAEAMSEIEGYMQRLKDMAVEVC